MRMWRGKSVEEHLSQGKALLTAKRNDEARAVFARAVELAPSHFEPWACLASACVITGRYEEAVRALRTRSCAQSRSRRDMDE